MMRFIESGNGKKTNLDQDVKLLIDQGNVPKAIELISEEMDRNPSDWYLAYLLGWIHQFDNNAEDALKAYKRAEQLASDNLQLKATIGELLMAVGQEEIALPYLESSILAWPESSEAYSLFGIALLRTGKTEQAEKILKKSCQLSNYNPDARAGLVELYSQTSQIHLIKPILETYLNSAPDLASSYSLMADYMLTEEGNCEGACAYYDKAINLFSQSENPDWFRQYLYTSDYPESELESYLAALAQCEYYEIIREVVKEHLNPPRSVFWLADVLQKEGDLKSSLQLLQPGVEADPVDPNIRAKYAELLLTNEQPNTSEQEVMIAINLCKELGFNEPWYEGLFIVSLSEQGRPEEVEKHIQQINPEYSERTTTSMIYFYSQLGRWKKAIQLCRQMLQEELMNSIALHYLAKAYLGNNQYSESVESYKRLLEQQPGNGRAQLEIGFAYEKGGLIEDAIEAYKFALAGKNLSIPHQAIANKALINLREII